MDLCAPYAKAIRETIPEAKITIDRFHLIKLLNKSLWDLNKKTYSKLDKIQRKRYSNIRYILSKCYKELLKDEKRLLKEYFKINVDIKDLYELIQDFRKILFGFRKSDRKFIEDKLYQWILKTDGKMKTFLGTLGRWFDEIVNACIYSNSNARQEGINNKIKLVKRRAFGYRNWKNFKYRIMAECNP